MHVVETGCWCCELAVNVVGAGCWWWVPVLVLGAGCWCCELAVREMACRTNRNAKAAKARYEDYVEDNFMLWHGSEMLINGLFQAT